MTLTRRIALFMAAVLLLALGGALLIHTWAAHGALQQQLELRNRDAAASLALALSQQHGDQATLQAVAAAQFDLGHYRSIVLQAGTGAPLIQLRQAAPGSNAPAWFVRLLPLVVAPGTALVSSGWTELGQLRVETHTNWAQDALWQACASTALLMAALAAGAAALTTVLLRAWQRPLAATVAQAQALEHGQFVLAELPDLPELQHLTRSMNATVRRVREMFAVQAQQVAYLQRRAQLDPLTGLPLRQHFMQALERRLAQADGEGLPLVLVRVSQLAQINQLHGHEAADAVLRQVAAVLNRHLQAEPDSVAGRLGGGDFALCLALPGAAAEAAPALFRALREAVAQVAPGTQVRLAAQEGATGAHAESALARAMLGLAEAEADAAGLVVSPAGAGAQALAQQETWRAQIVSALAEQRLRIGEFEVLDALAEQRLRIGEFEVLDAQGGLIHLECPLRLQLNPRGDYQAAGKWLAMARRCGLMPQVDQAAIAQVLRAIGKDGRPRAVNLALSSLAEPGWVAAVQALLQAQPQAARQLSVEWVDAPSHTPFSNAADDTGWRTAQPAMAAWRAHGVRMGVEHAGAAPEQLARLRDLGLDYVKVDGLHLRGAATDASVHAYARSLVGLVQLLGLQALAEGMDNAEDLATLWQLGFDGATGKALRLAPPTAEVSASSPPPEPALAADAAA